MMSDAEHAFYTVRLLLRFSARTRIILEVLRSDRVVQGKVAYRSPPTIKEKQQANERPLGAKGRSLWPSARSPSVKRRRRCASIDHGCYLCTIDHADLIEEEDDGVEEPSPLVVENRKCCNRKKKPLVYLPISKTQPPLPPLRSSSLPRSKRLRNLKHVEGICFPMAPLSAFNCSRKDGYAFQRLVLEAKSGLVQIIGQSLSRLLLQVSVHEPCIFHLVLGIASIRRLRNARQARTALPCNNFHHKIFRHYFLARDFLNDAVAIPNYLTRELSFTACYLFTIFETLIGSRAHASKWLKRAYKLLKVAIKDCGADIDGIGLPTGMREVALAFGRLNLRSIEP